MIRDILRKAHDLCKGHQDRLVRGCKDSPDCQLAAIMARAKQIGIPSGPRLDVGGGNGRYRGLLADDGVRVVGIDKFVAANADLVGDAHCLPVRSESTAFVLLAEVLEHLPEPSEAVRECFRVLRPGGILAITGPQYWHVHGHPSDYYRFTDVGFRYLCERAGFTVLDCWSRGGPALILYHAVEVNLSPRWRPLFVIGFCRLAEWIDRVSYEPRPTGRHYDALGWSLVARKPL